MKSRIALLLMLLGAPSLMMAQQQFVPYPANDVQFTAPPPPAPSLTASYSGAPGQQNVWYWVVATYVRGQSGASTAVSLQILGNPTVANPVQLSWNSTGASSYSVLRSNTGTFLSPCTCLVGTTAGTTLTDSGGALSSFVHNPVGPATGSLRLDNRDSAVPTWTFTPAAAIPPGAINTAANYTWTGTHLFAPVVSTENTLMLLGSFASGVYVKPVAALAGAATRYSALGVTLDMPDGSTFGGYGVVSDVQAATTTTGPVSGAWFNVGDIAGGNTISVTGANVFVDSLLADNTLHQAVGVEGMLIRSAGTKKSATGIRVLAGTTTAFKESIHVQGYDVYGLHVTKSTVGDAGYAGIFLEGAGAPLRMSGITAPAAPPADNLYVYAKSGAPEQLCAKDDAGTETCFGSGGGGSVLRELTFAFAGCVAANGVTLMNDSGTGETRPTAACNDTGNIQRPSLNYSGTLVNGNSLTLPLPSNANLAVTWAFDLWYVTTAAGPTGNVNWQIATVCRAVGEDWNGTYNATQTIVDAVGAQNAINVASIADLTKTDCAADEHMTIRIVRDGATDTNNDLAVALNWRVTMEVNQ